MWNLIATALDLIKLILSNFTMSRKERDKHEWLKIEAEVDANDKERRRNRDHRRELTGLSKDSTKGASKGRD